MEFGIEFLFFAGLITGAIGLVLGMIVDKALAGFWLGAFLGPIGWIIVFLLPRDSEIKEDRPTQVSPKQNMPELSLEDTDISSDSYRLYLGKKYDIQRNDLFQQFECREKLFESLDVALAFADELEREEREKRRNRPLFSKQMLTRIENDLNEKLISIWIERVANNEAIYVVKDKNLEAIRLSWDELHEYWEEKMA